MKKPLVIAHRGCSGEAPENTLAAFKLALEQGCDAIELDVHYSRDGEIIVCHDTTIDRTSNGSGAINDLTVQEIQQADAGSWFSEKYAGERIPTLSEVFELVPPSIMINVEVKDLYGEEGERRLVKFLQESGRVPHVVISSFNHELLLRLKKLDPELKIGLLYDRQVDSHHGLAEQLGGPVYSLHPHFRLLSDADVAAAVEHGLEVYVWTVNSDEDMKLVVGQGVTGVITDFPGKLKQMLAAK